MSRTGYFRDQTERLARQGRVTENRNTNMSQFAQFTAPEAVEGDRFIPKDNAGHVIVVRVNEHKTGIVTSNSPNGTAAIGADVVDLDAPDEPAVYHDTLLFGGAFTDALKNYVGQKVVVKIEVRTSKSGRTYAAPGEAQSSDIKRAEELFAKGDPFAGPLSTVQPVPPF